MNEQAVLPIVNLLRQVLTGYCKYPADLTVRLEPSGKLIVHPHIVDYPRIIGKDGRFVKAFKYMAEFLSHQVGVGSLDFVLKDSPRKGQPEEPVKVPYDRTYDVDRVFRMIEEFIIISGARFSKMVSCEDDEEQDQKKKFIACQHAVDPELDHDFLANLRTIFEGFGRFQGVGDIEISVVQPPRGRGGVEGGPRCVQGSPKGKKGVASC